jgi:DHA2 family multidrug resistance protein-like MFS transporter
MSPLTAALWSLAPSVVVGAAAPLAARLSLTWGRPPVMAAGFMLSVAGFALLARMQLTSSLAYVLVAAALIAGGLVAVLSLIADYVLGAAPTDRAGAVAGLTETSSEFGGALGMAVLGSILAAIYHAQVAGLLPAGLSPDALAEAEQTLAGAVSVAAQAPGPVGDAVLLAGRTAYVTALNGASLVAAGVLVVAAVVTLTLLRETRDNAENTRVERDATFTRAHESQPPRAR